MDTSTQRTVTEVIHDQIEELAKQDAITPQQAQSLKARLTVSVIEQHIRDGMPTRDIIQQHINTANRTGLTPPAPPQKPAASPEEEFAEQVMACVDELNAVLPRIAHRYEDLVIVAALAEHVGGALRVFMRTGICNQEQARRVLKHIEEATFPNEEPERRRS